MPGFPVAEIPDPAGSSRGLVGVVLESNSESTSVLIGRGVQGGPVVAVASPNVKYVSDFSLPKDSKLVAMHMPPSTIASTTSVHDAATKSEINHPSLASQSQQGSARQSSSVALIQKMALAPVDGLIGWDVAPLTMMFIILACFVALIRNSAVVLGQPVFEKGLILGPTEPLQKLLLHVAGGLAIACSTRRLDASFDADLTPTGGTRLRPCVMRVGYFRLVIVALIVVATSIHTVHWDWTVANEGRKTAAGGNAFVRLAIALSPWVPPLEFTCLYGVAAVAIASKIVDFAFHRPSD